MSLASPFADILEGIVTGKVYPTTRGAALEISGTQQRWDLAVFDPSIGVLFFQISHQNCELRPEAREITTFPRVVKTMMSSKPTIP